jgi:hypothetical protein
MKHALVPFLGLVLFGMAAEAQNADVSAQLRYPPTILYNGKIVTVPEDRIPTIRVPMAAVGGEVVHLTSPFASEVGMPAVGATAWKEPIPEAWDESFGAARILLDMNRRTS